MAYHINDAGEAGFCKAEKGGCPFGTAENHYTSAKAAREAYEVKMKTQPETLTKASATGFPLHEAFNSPTLFDYTAAESEILTKANFFKDPVGGEAKYKKFAASLKRATHVARKRLSLALAYHNELSSNDIMLQKPTGEGKFVHPMPAEEALAGAIPRLSTESQKRYYSLASKMLPTLVGTHETKPYSRASIEALMDYSDFVLKNDPNYYPKLSHVPNRASGNVADSGAMQMQNVSPATTHLLEAYVLQKFGNRSQEFWATVHSDTANYPKLSDFAKADKLFSKVS